MYGIYLVLEVAICYSSIPLHDGIRKGAVIDNYLGIQVHTQRASMLFLLLA